MSSSATIAVRFAKLVLPLSPFPYALVYTVEADRILILAVVHTARRDDYWLGRLRPPQA